jgi:serine/threonine protein phosphatase PrpC
MEQDAIRVNIQLWLSRRVGNSAVKELFDSSVSIGSDIGIVRNENQDRAIFVQVQMSVSKSFVIGVLCDGMGGMIAGAECANISVASFVSSCIRNRQIPVGSRLIKAVEDANAEVYLKFEGDGGATLSAFICDSDGVFEAINVGDSRIYANHGQNIKQYSKDDTLAGQYKGAADSHLGNRLLQYVGVGPEIEPHILSFPSVEDITQLVLTSDGAHYIESGTFKQIFQQKLPALELCKRVIHVSKWCGGHDNSTVMVINDLWGLLSCSDEKSFIPPGTIKLWDSFGEIQLIGITATTRKNPRRRVARNNTENESASYKNEEIEPLTEKVKKRTFRRKSVKKNVDEKDGEDEVAPKPQLRIDFE